MGTKEENKEEMGGKQKVKVEGDNKDTIERRCGTVRKRERQRVRMCDRERDREKEEPNLETIYGTLDRQSTDSCLQKLC